MGAPRVAICQSDIILGGRLRVIIGLCSVLNEMGIIPDVLSSRRKVTNDYLERHYGEKINFRFRDLPRVPKSHYDFAILIFNAMLKYYGAPYDLLINMSDSVSYLPRDRRVLTIMFFPRKRVLEDAVNSLSAEPAARAGWRRKAEYLQRRLQLKLSQAVQFTKNHTLVCQSEYVRDVMRKTYSDLPDEVPIIYPPVDLAPFLANPGNRAQRVATLGRFTPDKRQLEQIRVAEILPDFEFEIMGFVNNQKYFEECRELVGKLELTNVHLGTNLPFQEVISRIQASRFFLHTMIEEHFGITSAQGIAAGCVPLVHDSGGSREVVPDRKLRYNNLEEAVEKLQELDRLPVEEHREIVRSLQDHVKTNFDAPVFHSKMKGVLESLLQGAEGKASGKHDG